MMSDSIKLIKLQTSSILHVPILNYENNFTFIVNNKEYYTNRLVADLLSPKIAKSHLIDPTISEYIINTRSKGDFNKILDLAKFEEQEYSKEEIPFIIEILENLENTTKFTSNEPKQNFEKDDSMISKVINQLKNHLEFPHFYDEQIKQEIEILSEHFYDMSAEEKDMISQFGYDIIDSIISHPKLQVESEDDLVYFINELYAKDSEYSNLYSYVYFKNVSSSTMKEFIEKVYYEDITRGTWRSLSERLSEDINNDDPTKSEKEATTRKTKCQRYKKHQEKKSSDSSMTIMYENQNFSGLIKYLQKELDIREEINITSSSIGGTPSRDPWSVISYEEQTKCFFTNIEETPWICIEFKRHTIAPTHYSIRSGEDSDNPKSFVLEGSKDMVVWTTIDQENNCSNLKEKRAVSTFSIQNDNHQSYKYLRLRHIGPTWSNQPRLQISSIEFYGQLI